MARKDDLRKLYASGAIELDELLKLEQEMTMARPKGSKNKVRTINVSGGTEAPRRRRRRDAEPSGVPVIVVDGGGAQAGAQAAPAKRRSAGKGVRRGSFKKRTIKGFRQVVGKPLSGGWGVALKLAGAGLGGIAGEAATEYVQATSSTADDKVVGVGKPIAAGAFVWIGQKMRGKLQALGEVLEHMGSGLFGQTAGDYTSRKASAAIKSATAKSGNGGSKSGL